MKVIIAGTDPGKIGFLDGFVKELLALVRVEGEVERVSTSDELVERVRGGGYALVFTYYSLGEPGGSGVEATTLIRKFDTETPIHLIGGFRAVRSGAIPLGQMLQKKALEAGANSYVPTAYPKEIDLAVYDAVSQHFSNL